MQNIKSALENSRLYIHFTCNENGLLSYTNNAFNNTYTHIRPKSVQEIASDWLPVRNAIEQAINNPNKHIAIYLECKDLNGGVMIMSYEVFLYEGVLNFIGFLSLDLQEFDEKMFQVLKNEVAQFRFQVNHNVRGPLAKVMGLNAILKQAKSMDEVRELSEKIGDASNELDNAMHNLINTLL